MIKKTWKVKVEVKVPVLVVVEAEDRDRALAAGQERAKAVIHGHLPERRRSGPYEYVATEALEMIAPKAMHA